ncbi:MAG: 30S ribosomal protein S6 [Candidatus Dojkabacteria bacterium]|nr:MAG: 30S ribosomal protein S6 [Candidatus Dojkabacteria bacterium]
MAEKMQKYELMMALKPLLPDDVRKTIHKNVISTVTEMGGELVDTDVWGKRYLAYKIKGHNEGYYILYVLNMKPEDVAELKRQLSLKQEILRFMVVKVEHKDEKNLAIKKKEIEV